MFPNYAMLMKAPHFRSGGFPYLWFSPIFLISLGIYILFKMQAMVWYLCKTALGKQNPNARYLAFKARHNDKKQSNGSAHLQYLFSVRRVCSTWISWSWSRVSILFLVKSELLPVTCLLRPQISGTN
jgi:hypothetical protein